MAKQLELTKGYYALVDDEDFESVSKYRWFALVRGSYVRAYRHEGRANVALHTHIMSPPDGRMVDHIDGNALDCRRSNMRVCTKTENNRNQRLKRFNTSGYKGVYQLGTKWVAQILVNGRARRLGTFETKEAAARAYDDGARHQFGEFAALNFPSPGEKSALESPPVFRHAESTTSVARRNANAKWGYKGITWKPKAQKFFVRVCTGGIQHSVGWFEDAASAALAYDEAARKLVGPRARLNFPKEGEYAA